MGALAHDNGDSVDNVDAVVKELLALVWVVGHQFKVGDAHRIQHLGGEVVAAGIGRQAESEVGVQRVVTFVLERVGLHFGVEADAPSFLPEVNNGPVPCLLDSLHGGFELRPAVAALRTEGVTGQTLGVDANQRSTLGEVANKENAVLFARGRISESTDAKLAELCGEHGLGLRLWCG